MAWDELIRARDAVALMVTEKWGRNLLYDPVRRQWFERSGDLWKRDKLGIVAVNLARDAARLLNTVMNKAWLGSADFTDAVERRLRRSPEFEGTIPYGMPEQWLTERTERHGDTTHKPDEREMYRDFVIWRIMRGESLMGVRQWRRELKSDLRGLCLRSWENCGLMMGGHHQQQRNYHHHFRSKV